MDVRAAARSVGVDNGDSVLPGCRWRQPDRIPGNPYGGLASAPGVRWRPNRRDPADRQQPGPAGTWAALRHRGGGPMKGGRAIAGTDSCQCDSGSPPPTANPAGLTQIAYRVADFAG